MENKFKIYFKKFFCLCLIVGQLVLLTGCSLFKPSDNDPSKPDGGNKPQNWAMEYWGYFDTISRIYSYAGETEEQFIANCDEAASLLSEYNKLFDIYNAYEKDDADKYKDEKDKYINNLYTLNKNAGGEPIELDKKLIEFLNYTKEIYTLTKGENNVMLGSVLKLWHDCRTAAEKDPNNARIPNMDDLVEASKHTSIDSLVIDTENNTAVITDPLASIDVGAIGKGYATEKVAQMLEAKGVNSYVLNIGGNIRIIGTKPDGSGWVTGIKDPFNKDYGYCFYLMLSNISCVTSGVYERFFTVNGKQYHHIIDKDTLMPAEGFASISIITKDSGLADSLSTALFTMTFEEGYELINSLEGVEALWVFSDKTIKFTDGIKDIQIEKK